MLFENDKTCVCHTSEQMIMCKSIANSISCATLMVWTMNLLNFIRFYFNGEFFNIEHSTLKYDVVKCVLLKRHTVEVISFQWTNEFYLPNAWNVSLCAKGNMGRLVVGTWCRINVKRSNSLSNYNNNKKKKRESVMS